MFVLAERTRERTATTGTGDLALLGTLAPNQRTFDVGVGVGNETPYMLISGDSVGWEEGFGTLSATTTFQRTTVTNNHLGTTAHISLTGESRVFSYIPGNFGLLFVKIFGGDATKQKLRYNGVTELWEATLDNGSWKQTVALATAAALPANTYSNGSSGIGATLTGNSNGLLTVDGVATVVGYRILVKDEATLANNGIYVVTTIGDGSHPYVLTRSVDYDDASDIDQADTVITGSAGAANGLTIWVSTIAFPFTLGTSNVNWSLVVGLPPITTNGYVLTIDGGIPVWAAPSGGGGGVTLDAKGNWASADNYSNGDVVRDRADFYVAIDTITAGPGTAPDIDGHNVAAATGTTGTTAITTTTAGDLIYLLFATKDSGNMTGVTSSLTFTQLYRETFGLYSLELWSAPAASILTSEAITANFSASLDYVVHVFAVKGNNPLVPLDRNASLPRYGNSGSSISGVSTSSPFDILFYFDMTDNPSGFDGTLAPSGFTWIQGTSYIPAQSSLSYKQVAGTQSNITLDAANGPANQTFVFAVTSDNPPPRLDPTNWVRLSGFDSTAFDDIIGNTPGGIPVRGSAAWGVLAPGTAGQIINFGTGGPQVVNFSAALDALSTTPGAIIQRGTSGYGVIAPGTNGQVLTMGSGIAATFADPSGGGGASVPTQASTGFTSSANLGGVATVSDSAAGVLISQSVSNGTAENWRIIYGTPPSPPYAIKARIALLSDFSYTDYAAVALGFYDGTKLEYIGLNIGSINPAAPLGVLTLGEYNSVSSSAGQTALGSPYPNPLWVQIENDGTAVHFGFSIDGEKFRSVKDENISGGFLSSYSNIFFGINPYASAAWGTLMEYEELT